MIGMWAALTWSFCAAALRLGVQSVLPICPRSGWVTELPADHGLKGNGLRSLV
jgi:hypothetical protein